MILVFISRIEKTSAKCGRHSNRQLPNLPGRLRPSTIGVWALNFCVRDGNRWAAQPSPPDMRGQVAPSKLYRRRNTGHFIESQALGVLVQVRSTPCGAPTPCLSTSCSARRLTILRYGKPHLRAGFTLRCFQRLSLPGAATRLHGWRHDRCTVGPSTPVLSY